MWRDHAKGFTFVEILMVLAIISILAAILVVSFQNINDHSTLRVSTQEVETALLSARNKTLASENDSVYGVHIDERRVIEFMGPTYSSTTPTTTAYAFMGPVTATSTLSSGGADIVFSRLTGYANATGTVTLLNTKSGATSSVVIHASGLIEKE